MERLRRNPSSDELQPKMMAMPVMGGYDAISLPVASTSAQPAAQQWGVWQQGQGGSLAPTESQGAPPVTQWWPQRRRKEDCEPDGAAAGPGVVHVAAPRIEAQPWARNFWRWMGDNTVGVARVDLRRPTPPPPNMYRRNNIFVVERSSGAEQGGKLTGARVKITRNFLFGQDPERRSKPLVDLGVGVAVEMDQASMQPVARLKFKNLVSIKAYPHGMIKVGGVLPLGATGLSAKVVYELPFHNIAHFWNPPARLMVRLESASGSGLHLSPTGVEFDERFVQLGSRLSVRAAVGLQFPRSLPIDPESDTIGFKVHRLSLKSLW